MMLRRRKNVVESEVGIQTTGMTPGELADKLVNNLSVDKVSLLDYLKFLFFCTLLLVPVYAIIKSAMRSDWLMMVIDVLLVPVGFVHGLLMLTGVVS